MRFPIQDRLSSVADAMYTPVPEECVCLFCGWLFMFLVLCQVKGNHIPIKLSRSHLVFFFLVVSFFFYIFRTLMERERERERNEARLATLASLVAAQKGKELECFSKG
jgi:hypothetical protein